MGITVNVNTNIRGKKRIGFIEGRNIRLHTNRIPLHSCHQVIHGSICSNCHTINMFWQETACTTHLFNKRINGFLNNGFLKLFAASWLHGFNNPVNDICAITNLSVSGQMPFPIISPVSILIKRADTVVVPISMARPPITTSASFGYTS